MADRRLVAALGFSLLMHAAVVGGPAWRLPMSGEEPEASVVLQAEIAATPRRDPVKRAKARPAAPSAAVRPVPAAEIAPAAAPVAEPPPEAAAPVAPVAAPQPAAVPEPREIAWPRQGRIRFVVTRGEDGRMELGQSVHSWSHDGAHYRLQSVAETTGLVALFKPVKVMQASEGDVGADGLVPREFHVERNGQPAEGARFDREAGRVVLTSAGVVRREAPLAEGAQDLLSQIHQLGLVGVAARLELMIATGKNYSRYVFEAAGEERLETRMGELRTWHLRTPGVPGEQATEVWLASDYRNLPVRIRHIDRKGDIFDQTAVELEFDGARLAGAGE